MDLTVKTALFVFAACVIYAVYFGEVKHGSSQDENSPGSPPK